MHRIRKERQLWKLVTHVRVAHTAHLDQLLLLDVRLVNIMHKRELQAKMIAYYALKAHTALQAVPRLLQVSVDKVTGAEKVAQVKLKTKLLLDSIPQPLLLFNCHVFTELFKALKIRVHALSARLEIIAQIQQEQQS